MALADRPTQPTQAGPRCGVAITIDQMDPADVATLRAWLADPTVRSSVIHANLTAEYPDCRLKADTVRRHRKGDCSCGAL